MTPSLPPLNRVYRCQYRLRPDCRRLAEDLYYIPTPLFPSDPSGPWNRTPICKSCLDNMIQRDEAAMSITPKSYRAENTRDTP